MIYAGGIMNKKQKLTAALAATTFVFALSGSPGQAEPPGRVQPLAGSCVVPWSACETGAVPAEDGAVWVAITTPAANLCDWQVRDTNNWQIVKRRTTGGWTERITGLHSWYRLELTNCRTSSTGTIW
jgi:hypothetical protein